MSSINIVHQKGDNVDACVCHSLSIFSGAFVKSNVVCYHSITVLFLSVNFVYTYERHVFMCKNGHIGTSHAISLRMEIRINCARKC